jgi:predicted XRE-type DNA-binding protein
MTKSKKTDIEIEEGSGNVFADLDLPGADELFARAQIGFHVFKILEERNLKQREIAALLRIPQPEVSHLMNGHSSRFTTDKLLDFLKRLNQTVTIQIRPHSPGEPYQKVRFATTSRTVGPPARIRKRKRTVPA